MDREAIEQFVEAGAVFMILRSRCRFAAMKAGPELVPELLYDMLGSSQAPYFTNGIVPVVFVDETETIFLAEHSSIIQ